MSNVFFYEPFYDVERIIEQAFATRPAARNGNEVEKNFNTASMSLKPKMDLHEDKDKNLVTAYFEFPGVSKEDVQIDVHNGRLIVSAETKQSSDHDEHGYAVRERRFGKYSRTFQLPQGITDEEIKASMENGVLAISFPKSTPELVPKRVTIN